VVKCFGKLGAEEIHRLEAYLPTRIHHETKTASARKQIITDRPREVSVQFAA
jgi:ribosomal protein S3